MDRNMFTGGFPRTISRRGFLRACAIATAVMGLPMEMVSRVAEAAEDPKRPRVVWLHFQECTGCSESLLRASHPDLATLILDLIDLEYHESLMAGAGPQAEEAFERAIEKPNYILVVEGAIPTGDCEDFCMIGGHSAAHNLKRAAKNALAIINIGTCSAYGGIPAAKPNPTKAVGTADIVKDKPILNIPGCPPNPHNFLSAVLYFLTFKKLPPTDIYGRPLFAYGRRIHDHCERRPHFDEGRYVEQFGDEGHRLGYCLYKMGCKAPETFSNCPVIRFNDAEVWPVSVGNGCYGCTEPNFWDTMTPFHKRLPGVSLPVKGGIIANATDIGKKALGVTAAALAIHAGIGVAKSLAKGKKEED
ncbi:hydrogenase small subunit [Desulfurobacterium sp.]